MYITKSRKNIYFIYEVKKKYIFHLRAICVAKNMAKKVTDSFCKLQQ
jgi:hypothetical protein